MKNKDIERRLEKMVASLLTEIFRIFEKRNKDEEIDIDVTINNSHYTKIIAELDRYGVALSIKEENTESYGTIRTYYNDVDALDCLPSSRYIK